MELISSQKYIQKTIWYWCSRFWERKHWVNLKLSFSLFLLVTCSGLYLAMCPVHSDTLKLNNIQLIPTPVEDYPLPPNISVEKKMSIWMGCIFFFILCFNLGKWQHCQMCMFMYISFIWLQFLNVYWTIKPRIWNLEWGQ